MLFEALGDRKNPAVLFFHAIGKAGADFKREFTLDTYKRFFSDAGYTDARYVLCEGRIPCAAAILQKSEKSGTV